MKKILVLINLTLVTVIAFAQDLDSKYASQISARSLKNCSFSKRLGVTSKDMANELQQLSGKEVGVNATPTLYINGRKVLNISSTPLDQLKSMINYEVAQPGK